MNRRGFLGALMASAGYVALSPLEKLYVYTAVNTEPVASFSDITSALKQIYPPGYFAEILERQSPFRRAITEKL